MYYDVFFFLLQSKFSSTDITFIHRLFCFKWTFLTGNIFSRTFPDFVKRKDISRTWKINLFSRISRTCGNPVSNGIVFLPFFISLSFCCSLHILIFSGSMRSTYGCFTVVYESLGSSCCWD